MSKPPINPDKTAAGIAIDPQTLERVIPESKRSDGTVRKQIKIRPGFTPQEDVRRFRGTKQAQMDANTLPKGHIIGWAPPPQSTAASGSTTKPLSKSAKKNAKRREKKEEKKEVPESWEDEEGEDGNTPAVKTTSTGSGDNGSNKSSNANSETGHTRDQSKGTAAPEPDPTATTTSDVDVDALISKVEKLGVK